MTPALAASGIHHHIGGSRVLGPIDLSVETHEIVALVGPNGAGKSTLLGVLSGDLGGGEGVSIDGRRMPAIPSSDLAKLRAVLPQVSTVSFPFKVHEIVAMGRAPWRRSPLADENEAVVQSAMAECDIAHLAHRSITKLSGGERARVALARVLAQSTPLLLLDEPTAALDIHHQERVFGLLRDRRDRGCAVVVVVHDLSLAAAYSDRVIVLSDGVVIADGPPRESLQPDVLSHVYNHRINVIEHPQTLMPLVVPAR